MLERRPTCERCERALPADAVAVICSFECTSCTSCGEALAGRCPNCAGEVVERPRRTA